MAVSLIKMLLMRWPWSSGGNRNEAVMSGSEASPVHLPIRRRIIRGKSFPSAPQKSFT